MSRESQVGVSLYSRKVLIKSKADNIMPNWLRFMKGKLQSRVSYLIVYTKQLIPFKVIQISLFRCC